MCLGAPEFWDGDVSHIQRHIYCSIAGPTPRSFLSLQLSEPERKCVCVCVTVGSRDLWRTVSDEAG